MKMLTDVLNYAFYAALAWLAWKLLLSEIGTYRRDRDRQEWLRRWHIERRVTEGDLWGPSRAKELRRG